MATASVLASAAFAVPTVTLYTNSYSDAARGGEFTAITNPTLDMSSYSSVAKYSHNGAQGFETFCVEYTEEFNPGTSYNYYLSNKSDAQDKPTGNSPLTAGTALLYSKFATGNLQGYDYASSGAGGTSFSSRANAALSLQLAIWWLEGQNPYIESSYQLGSTYLNSNKALYDYLDLVLGLSPNTVVTSGNGALVAAQNDIYSGSSVQIMNLYSGSNPSSASCQAQSQLYYHSVPDGGATAALLGLALLALAAVRRRIC